MPAMVSSSCRLCTSFFKMRMDWPRDFAAYGSFFDPNSTMITTATIKIFHGLSNRSPITSVLLLKAGLEWIRSRTPLGWVRTGTFGTYTRVTEGGGRAWRYMTRWDDVDLTKQR